MGTRPNYSRFPVPPGASPKDIQGWEQANYPYLLPHDLARFFQVANGMMVRWSAMVGPGEHHTLTTVVKLILLSPLASVLGDSRAPLGLVHINSISKLKMLSSTGVRLSKQLRREFSLELLPSDSDSSDEEEDVGGTIISKPNKNVTLSLFAYFINCNFFS